MEGITPFLHAISGRAHAIYGHGMGWDCVAWIACFRKDCAVRGRRTRGGMRWTRTPTATGVSPNRSFACNLPVSVYFSKGWCYRPLKFKSIRNTQITTELSYTVGKVGRTLGVATVEITNNRILPLPFPLPSLVMS